MDISIALLYFLVVLNLAKCDLEFSCLRDYIRSTSERFATTDLTVIQHSTSADSIFERSFLHESFELLSTTLMITTANQIVDTQHQRRNFAIFIDAKNIKQATSELKFHRSLDDFFHVIVDNHLASENQSEFSSAMKEFSKLFGRNFVVLQRENVTFWRAWKFLSKNCSLLKVEPLEIGQCHSGHFEMKKINTKCAIHVLAMHNPPFTLYEDGLGFHSGIDFHLTQLVAQKIGRKIQFTLVREPISSFLIEKTLKMDINADDWFVT